MIQRTQFYNLCKQFSGYLLNGCVATFVHYSLLILLAEGLACKPALASSVGFLFGAITGFLLNRKTVFSNLGNPIMTLLQYLLLALISGITNTSILLYLTKQLDMHYLFAQIIATGSVIMVNFSVCKFLIFRDNRHAKQ